MVRTRFLAFVPAALLAAACGGSSSPTTPATNFSATMNAASEVPPTTSTATGTATFVVVGTTVNFTVTWNGLSGPPTAGHIHVGATTVAGPVVVPFTGLPATASGTFSSSFTQANIKPQTNPVINTLDDLLVQMRAGNTYANLHTTANPGGEIRGQLQPL
jgi:hypothetical protein